MWGRQEKVGQEEQKLGKRKGLCERTNTKEQHNQRKQDKTQDLGY